VAALAQDYARASTAATLAAEALKGYAGLGSESALAVDRFRDVAGIASGATLATEALTNYARLASSSIEAADRFREMAGIASGATLAIDALKGYEVFPGLSSETGMMFNSDFILVRSPDLVRDPVTELITWIGEQYRSIPGWMAKAKQKFVDLCVFACGALLRLRARVPLDEAMSGACSFVRDLIDGGW